MLQCSPKCPTVRRQLREQVKKSGWTDEYVRNLVDVRRVDIARDLDRGLGHQVKPERRRSIGRKPDSRKRASQELAIKDQRTRDLVRVTDYDQPIAETDWRKDGIQEPVASLKQESIYYTEERQVARVDPIRRVVPEESRPREALRPVSGTPISGTPTYGPPISGTATYGPPISGTATYGPPISGTPTYGPPISGTATYGPPISGTPTYGPPISGTPTYGIPISGTPIEDETRYVTGKGEVSVDEAVPYREPSASKGVDYETPGPSKRVDKQTIRSRDGSPDSYYKYTPKEVSSDWPHDDCDETCPAGILKARAEKLLGDGQRRAVRYSTIGHSYFDDVCTCSLPCMVQNLRKDPFVRSIITSAIFFAIGLKLCSELHGWYIPISA